MPTRHPQVHIEVGTREADVDADIAPLIQELWNADIDTVLSCQDNPSGWVWIEFGSVDCERFLSIVAEFNPDPESLYNRITQVGDSGDEDNWDYRIRFIDFGVDEGDDGYEVQVAPTDISAFVSVRFPHRDLPIVFERVKAFNETRKHQSWRSRFAMVPMAGK